MANNTYESASVIVNWNGVDLSEGWAEDTFLTIEPLTERVGTTFGADGSMTPSKMANKGATITLTLAQTAQTNKDIAAIWKAQEILGAQIPVGPFTVIDQVGDSAHFVALNAVLTEVPGHSFANAVGEKAWVWVCESYFETDDQDAITQALQDYIRVN